VILWDFGSKHSIIQELVRRNCKVIVVPADYSAEEVLACQPDGIVLSNGPGVTRKPVPMP
jgi:carbamoyl-phosphate synthase small subunit